MMNTHLQNQNLIIELLRKAFYVNFKEQSVIIFFLRQGGYVQKVCVVHVRVRYCTICVCVRFVNSRTTKACLILFTTRRELTPPIGVKKMIFVSNKKNRERSIF